MNGTLKLVIYLLIYLFFAFEPIKELAEGVSEQIEHKRNKQRNKNNNKKRKERYGKLERNKRGRRGIEGGHDSEDCNGEGHTHKAEKHHHEEGKHSHEEGHHHEKGNHSHEEGHHHHEGFSIFDENFLMIIASLGAFIMGDRLEAIAVLFFFKIGELFEERAVEKAKKNISDLMDIRPDYANVMENGELIKVSPETLKVGDIIYVKAGEKIPLDGEILSISGVNIESKESADSGANVDNGENANIGMNIDSSANFGYLDTSSLTGESKLRKVGIGSQVLSGMVNQSATNREVLSGSDKGTLGIRVTRGFGESTVKKILDLVENAQEKKSQSEAFITRFARVYTPIVCGLALLVAVVPPIVISLFGQSELMGHGNLLGNSSLMLGQGNLLGDGGFLTGNAALWRTWIYRALTFLVISCPCALVISIPLTFFAGIGGASRNGILIKGSNYLEALSKVEAIAFDKTGTITKGYVSSAGAMNDNSAGAINDSSAGTMNDDSAGAKNDVFNGANDEVKDEAKDAILGLKKLGLKLTCLLTGDTKEIGEKIGNSVGMDKVYTELLPQEKVEKVEELLEQYSPVAYVGDGINDAPVLMRADIGISMGKMGTDASVEASDIVLMDDNLLKIPEAIRLSKKVMRIAYENIAFSISVKVACMVLSTLGITGMWLAILADTGVMVLCVLNAMRALYNLRQKTQKSSASGMNAFEN